jgi:TolB-like protein
VLGAGGLYLAVSLILLAVTQFLLVQLGLPDWVMPGVGVLLLIGLPVTVAAAHSEIRIANGRAPLLPFLSWNNVMRAGVLAMGGWSALVAGYMGMRLLGVGPVGTLVAAGVLEERERVVVADFENRTANSLLGRAVTEAFRVDLAQSPVVTLMSPASVARVLALMERPADEPVTEEVAREVALREGLKAVVAGDVTAVGGSYVLSARMVSAQDGNLLAAFRETAADSTEIIDAVDRLSDRLRSRIGESLKSIRANEPLAAVTTESLEALVKYSQAMQMVNQGDVTEALQLLRDAVELDTAFAMAYRKIGVSALSRAEQVDALTRAYRHRDRLTAMERNLLEAAYHTVVTDDENAASRHRVGIELDVRVRERDHRAGGAGQVRRGGRGAGAARRVHARQPPPEAVGSGPRERAGRLRWGHRDRGGVPGGAARRPVVVRSRELQVIEPRSHQRKDRGGTGSSGRRPAARDRVGTARARAEQRGAAGVRGSVVPWGQGRRDASGG